MEDLIAPCPRCGKFVGGVIGPRDWLSRHRPERREGWHERDDEVRELVVNARHSALGRLWRRVKRITSQRDPEPEEPEELEELEAESDPDASPWRLPVTVTRARLGEVDDSRLRCRDFRDCDAELPLTWTELAAAHDRMTPAEVNWLERYTGAKELIRLGLFHAGVGFRTPLGTFSTRAWPMLESAFGTIPAGAAPVFVVSAKLAKLCDSLDPAIVLSQLAGEERCMTPGEEDGLALPVYFEPPGANVDVELGLDLAQIASELRDRGATPLRGFGTLRLLEVDWISVSGKLVYLEFDESLREAIYEDVRGGEEPD